jgi:hypothetical protein
MAFDENQGALLAGTEVGEIVLRRAEHWKAAV